MVALGDLGVAGEEPEIGPVATAASAEAEAGARIAPPTPAEPAATA